MKLARYILLVAVLFCTLAVQASAATQQQLDNARSKGIAWLLQKQNGDGSWQMASGLKIQPTAAALDALVNAGIKSGYPFSSAVAWLGNAEALSVDGLARQSRTLYKCGNNVDTLMKRLDTMVHSGTKTWGAYANYYASFIDTSLAVDALVVTNTTTNAKTYLATSVAFIASRQIANNSGWGYAYMEPIASQTRLVPTAQSIISLSHYKKISTSVDANISRALTWLNTQKKADGGFSDDPNASAGNVHETALAYMALNEAKLSGNAVALNSTGVINAAQNFLISKQSSDGSWGGDPLLTALAIQTMPTTVLVDTDEDGIPDVVETILGTNPNLADSRLIANNNGQSIPGVTSPTLIGTAYLNQVFSKTITVNGGTAPYTWKISSGSLPAGLSLAGGTGVISGTPTTLGTYNFSYEITDAMGISSNVAGQIAVLTIPKISVSATSYDFGNVYVSTDSRVYTFTISNVGSAPLILGQLSFNAANFKVSSNTCTGKTLQPVANCMLSVSFSPLSTGLKNVSISIPSNDPNSANTVVTLSGTGVLPVLAVVKSGTGSGVVSNGSSISCGSTCSASFMTDTVTTLTATPDSNNVFTGWSGKGCSGTGACTVTMNADKTVTATFNKNYSLNVDVSGTGGGTVTLTPPSMACNTDCSSIYVSNDQVVLTATPYEYSVFSGWTNGPCTGTGSCSLLMTANTTVTASFNKDIQHQVKFNVGSTPYYFSTIQGAYNAAASGTNIQLWGTEFTENVICGNAKTIVLQGGYNQDFSAVSGKTTLKGKLTVNSGSRLNVNNLTIEPSAP